MIYYHYFFHLPSPEILDSTELILDMQVHHSGFLKSILNRQKNVFKKIITLLEMTETTEETALRPGDHSFIYA